jgi:hypothetical protein
MRPAGMLDLRAGLRRIDLHAADGIDDVHWIVKEA